jgi:hypothetical protein
LDELHHELGGAKILQGNSNDGIVGINVLVVLQVTPRECFNSSDAARRAYFKWTAFSKDKYLA